ncbi:LLM class flavin-dependent oxidoreductase [Pseudonocardia asaccharolytica]|uniref:LLM class flavin-dependent oxidoreductase n=1 Tax=Pseudonocardia asaccharolytica TaxID=54010 RepID=UPI0004186B27|nr:LLM class flavin-dependent oxidoreductase [Pseudonocardia asaccharolytica]
MSIGFTGFGPLGPTFEAVRAAEEGGLDGVWSAEHIGFHDAVVPSAAYLATTERIDVGLVGLAPASRHPAMTATELTSLCELGPGRVRVQVGTGDATLVAKLGARHPRPLETVAAYVRVLRDVLAGRELHVELPVGRFDGFQLAPVAVPPAIDVMAIRSKMLRLAAEIGDGVSLSAGASETYLTETVAEIEAHLAEQGRDRGSFRITAFAFGLVAPDPEPLVSAFGALLTTFPAETAAYLARGAFDTDAYLAAVAATRTLQAAKLITPEVVRAITFTAAPDEIATELARYAATGVDELAILLVTPPPLLADAVTAIAAPRSADLQEV